MSLAQAAVPTSEFDDLYDHITIDYSPYRNMHMRQACQRNGRRELRYLHAMFAPHTKRPEIEGMISGPDAFWHYKLIRVRSRTQLNVLVERGSDKAIDRMGRQFLSEIRARVQQEREVQRYYPKRIPGQYYLRRRQPGSIVTHRNCVSAVASGTLDRTFVSKLEVWDLELLRP